MARRLAGACSTVIALAVMGACARPLSVGPPSTAPAAPAAVKAGAARSGGAGTITAAALGLVGVPYRSGGADPRGFDCSGLVQYVFAQRGIALPRSVGNQSRVGIAIPRQSIEAGDLVFFSTAGAGPSHVGIAIDRETFVHAPSSSGQVRVERLSAPYWAHRFAGARRVARRGS